MVLAASRKNGVRFFKVATLQRQAHLQPCNVPFSGSDKVWTGLQGCPFQRTALAPRRAQNLLAGCIFDGLACQKCFCVTLGKSNRTEEERFLRDCLQIKSQAKIERNLWAYGERKTATQRDCRQSASLSTRAGMSQSADPIDNRYSFTLP